MGWQILTHTPAWVFAVLGLLIWLGLRQMLTHELSLMRVTALAMAMTGLSLQGVLSAFGPSAVAVLLWLSSAVVLFVWLVRQPASPPIRYDAARRRLVMPGSVVPMLLMMGVFCAKFAVAAALSVQPALALDAVFVPLVSALYGGFTGVFAARATRLWRLALAADRAGTHSGWA